MDECTCVTGQDYMIGDSDDRRALPLFGQPGAAVPACVDLADGDR